MLQIATVSLCALAGCGTTKWSDSPRTATEQLLVSDAVDRAISQIDFSVLANKNVYLDTRFVVTALDQNYVVSTLRQHMLASGCIIKDKAEDAQYVVEVRSGSLGTNRQDLLLGIPATTLPSVGLLPTGAATIPEIALWKRTNQQGVCKIAVFAYDRMNGRPVWQSGNRQVASKARDTWVAGAGPFQRGTIHDGTSFAGEKVDVPLVTKDDPQAAERDRLSVGREKVFILDPLQHGPQMGYPDAQQAQYVAQAPSGPARQGPPQAPPPSGDPSQAPPPKAAYTPPPPPAAPPPQQSSGGPQGNLKAQAVLPPNANPATSTAGAIQMFNWARDFSERADPQP